MPNAFTPLQLQHNNNDTPRTHQADPLQGAPETREILATGDQAEDEEMDLFGDDHVDVEPLPNVLLQRRSPGKRSMRGNQSDTRVTPPKKKWTDTISHMQTTDPGVPYAIEQHSKRTHTTGRQLRR